MLVLVNVRMSLQVVVNGFLGRRQVPVVQASANLLKEIFAAVNENCETPVKAAIVIDKSLVQLSKITESILMPSCFQDLLSLSMSLVKELFFDIRIIVIPPEKIPCVFKNLLPFFWQFVLETFEIFYLCVQRAELVA